MRDILFITDAIAPLGAGEDAVAAAGLTRAFVAAGHRTTVLSLCSPAIAEDAAAYGMPGLARRLSGVEAQIGGRAVELALYEGRAAAVTDARILMVAAESHGRGHITAVLGSTVESLAKSGAVNPDVTIGWGETSAAALSGTAAAVRLFVLPAGRLGPLLAEDEAAALGTISYGDDSAGRSLAALGASSANAIVAPSPSAARSLEADPGLASRAADEPLLAVRLGSDEASNDPATDPALPAHYSLDSLSGKVECRRALARRASLALGPRTLLLATAPLDRASSVANLLAVLPRLSTFDVVVVIPAHGDRDALDRVRVMAIEHPGRIALVGDEEPTSRRQLLAAADAVLLCDEDDRTGRAAGSALRAGTLPIAPGVGATGDYLVDYDPSSGTGSAFLYAGTTPFEMESAIRRAITLRADADAWPVLTKALMTNAPTWAATAARIDSLFYTTDPA